MTDHYLLSVRESAVRLGYTPQHVRFLLRIGRLRGIRVGRDWVIHEDDLRAFQARRSNVLLFGAGREEHARAGGRL